MTAKKDAKLRNIYSVKLFIKLSLKRYLNIFKCPDDEIGSGSVKPCIKPKIIYFIKFIYPPLV